MTGWSAVLWDLDGTICESGPIIAAAMVPALADYGFDVSGRDLSEFIGPPLPQTIRELTGVAEPEQLAEIVAHYRAIYVTLMHDTPTYPGVADLLRKLAADGVPMAVATSKKEANARQMLVELDLASCFVTIRGASADESRARKADIVEDALADLRSAGIDLSRPVMIGDREHDVSGAAAHGVPTILVTWGYGTAAEAAAAYASVDDVSELAARLTAGA